MSSDSVPRIKGSPIITDALLRRVKVLQVSDPIVIYVRLRRASWRQRRCIISEESLPSIDMVSGPRLRFFITHPMIPFKSIGRCIGVSISTDIVITRLAQGSHLTR